MSIEEVVRAALPPQRARGHAVDSTDGINPDTPTAAFGDGDPAASMPLARTDRENNFRRWSQFGVTLADGEEIESTATVVSGAYVVNLRGPNILRLSVIGTSLSLGFTGFPPLPQGHERSLLHGALRCRTFELKINWLNSGTKTVASAGLMWPARTPPEWSDAPGLDVILVQVSSDGQILGFESGLDMGVPT